MDNVKIKNQYSSIEGECSVVETYPIVFSQTKYCVYLLLCVLTFGIFFIIVYWNTKIKREFLFNFCQINQASHFLVRNCDDSFDIVPKKLFKQTNATGYIQRHLTYIYDTELMMFQPLEFKFPIEKEFFSQIDGLTYTEYEIRSKLYEPCVIDIPIPTSCTLFFKEIIHPFFIFQFISVTIWLIEGYYIVSLFILISSFGTAFWNLSVTKENLKNISEMAHFVCEINVTRNKNLTKINSLNIVPGDIVEINKDMELPFDCIILTGEVIVDECSLTGESQPALKSGIDKVLNFGKEIDLKNFSLFSGTRALQTHPNNNNQCLAIVTATSFCTIKGQLVRNILYPKPIKFKFFYESMKFAALIGFIVMFTFLIVLPKLTKIFKLGETILRCFDIITIAIPAYLPTALNIGISYALARLKKKNIYCISPQKVVIGNIDTICFDKTGTITEEFMNFVGFLPCSNRVFESHIVINDIEAKRFQIAMDCLSSCHCIVRIEKEDKQYSIFGDPMELKAFEFAKASFISDKTIKREKEIKIVKSFEFSSKLQRMSVIVNYEDNLYTSTCFTKGSPEACKLFCNNESLPKDYEEILNKYSKKGLRILAMCYKEITEDPENIERENLENQMNFLGFIIFENPLKSEATETLKTLLNADFNTKIITGDNVLTAINVARKCKILRQEKIVIVDVEDDLSFEKKLKFTTLYNKNLDSMITSPRAKSQKNNESKENIEMCTIENERENSRPFFRDNANLSYLNHMIEKINGILIENHDFAFTGTAFDVLFAQNKDEIFSSKDPSLGIFFKKLLENSFVFARMSPQGKKLVIEFLQKFDSAVAMVGDGANDCGALKQADIGLALSQTEASVSASFTAKDLKLSSIVELIKQNRAGLVTSIQTFKFFALYGLIEFTSINILYYFFSDMANFQFFYIDFVISCTILGTMGLTDPYPYLSSKKPKISLFSCEIISSVIGLLLIQFSGQLLILEALKKEKFYNKYHYIEFHNLNHHLNEHSMENGTIFLFANFLYVASVIAISKAKPFRKPFYTNKYYSFAIAFLWIMNILLALYPKFFGGIITIDEKIEDTFRAKIVIFGHIFVVIMYLYENCFCVWLSKWMERKKK